jgi:NAD(P)H-dependent FMN reductase
LAAAAPEPVRVTIYPGIGSLPHFNPDLDTDDQRPAVVQVWRATIAAADAVVISSPEYAHGVPGSLKNALDWLVSGPEVPALPAALLNTAPRATHAQESLAETLKTMSADLLTPPVWTVPLAGRTLTLEQVLAAPELASPLKALLRALQTAIQAAREARRRLVGPSSVSASR